MEYIQAAEDPTPIYSVLASPQFVFIFIFSNSQNKILVGLKRPGNPKLLKNELMMFFSPVHGLLSFSASAPSVLSSPPMFYIPT